MFDCIRRGDLQNVNMDSLHCFLSIYPKENEIKCLKGKLADNGIGSFEAAQIAFSEGKLKCGKIEQFMIQLLSQTEDLRLKAQTMIEIEEMGPKINEIMTRVQCWKFVNQRITECSYLADLTAITLQMVSLMNSQPVAKGFKFNSFLKTFDIKSAHAREKPYYHFILK